MIKNRLYTEQALLVGESCVLEAAPSKHLIRVLRAGVGERCFLFNGDGAQYLAEITQAESRAVLRVLKQDCPLVESPLRITLAQGLSRGERMDYVIQKSVECGVHAIVPVMTSRCGVKLSEQRMLKRQAHWQAVAISACEQSGRCVVPKVELPVAFGHWVQRVTGVAIVADTTSGASTKRFVGVPSSCTVMIGPEGGVSSDELKQMYDRGFIGMSLGPRILRTETASVVAMTSLQMRWGDLNVSNADERKGR